AAVVRLVGAILAEQTDEWAVAKRYMSVESLRAGSSRALSPSTVVEAAAG
ncbi:MAG: IS256 family transposase, partial [Actinomycetota bacterium]|nr:IS256 family transposase [Actinomycetota bacterium]